MRLHSLTVSGIAPHYATPQTLDLANVRGPLVAITGPNGAGKSTLVNALRAALFRRFTSGSLADLATAADSYVRADVETTRGRFVVTQSVNGVSRTGKGETSIRDAAGHDLLSRAQVTEGDRWVKSHLPPWSLLAASTFAAQADQGLLAADLTPQDRREILFRALGLEAIEPLPGKCRARAGQARARGEVVDGKLSVERPRADVAGAEEAAGRAHATAAAAVGRIDAARAALDDARARHAALVEAHRNVEAAQRAHDEALGKVRATKATHESIGLRILEADTVLSGRDAVLAAAARVEEIDHEIPKAESALAEARERAEAGRAAVAAASRAESDAARRVHEAEQALQRASGASGDLAAARLAGSAIERLRGLVAATEKAVGEAEAEVARWNEASLDSAGKRILRLTCSLIQIVAYGAERCAEAPEIAERALASDAEIAAEAAEAPGRVKAARTALEDARATLAGHRAAAEKAERLAARLDDLERAESDRVTAEAARDQARADRAEAVKAAHAAKVRKDDVEGVERRAMDAIVKLRDERRVAATTAARATEIAAAEARRTELCAQHQDAFYGIRDAEAALAKAPAPPAEVPMPDVAAEQRELEDAESGLRRAEREVAVADRVLADARAAAARVAELEVERRAIDDEVADLVALERTFVAMLQLSIDAAGPELAAVANELLRGGFGDRYSVSVETQRIGDKGQQIEDCYVSVLDSQNGYAGPASGLSGGQLVIVGTAIRCALAALGARTAGIVAPSVVLDESGAALQRDLVPAWVAMLRAAARVIGAGHVLIVTHDPETQQLCDSVVRVTDGRIEIGA